MSVRLEPASMLDDERLAALFTAVYAGYAHPIALDAAALRRMVATYDLALDASVVAVDGGTPVGLGMLAIRGGEGWVGGMGVLPDRRGEGIGTQLTARLLANARERGLRRVRLEVLEQNAPAIAVYRKLGFADLRDVVVWRLDDAPDAPPAEDADVDDALDVLAAGADDAPWQRGPATIGRMRETGADLRAARVEGGVAVWSLQGTGAALLGIATSGERAAALLRAPFDRGAESLLFLNGPEDGPVARALDVAGAKRLALQHELAISP